MLISSVSAEKRQIKTIFVVLSSTNAAENKRVRLQHLLSSSLFYNELSFVPKTHLYWTERTALLFCMDDGLMLNHFLSLFLFCVIQQLVLELNLLFFVVRSRTN